MAAIAEALGRHCSTIHREIRRNFYHDPSRDRWGKEYKGYYCTSAQKAAARSPRNVRSSAARPTSPHGRALGIGNDRGTEFFAYKALPMDSYFCDPHSPWQKGGVENANGRLRRHLPLASPEADRSAPALAALAQHLNNIPRRCLDYRTPAEVFAANLAALSNPA